MTQARAGTTGSGFDMEQGRTRASTLTDDPGAASRESVA